MIVNPLDLDRLSMLPATHDPPRMQRGQPIHEWPARVAEWLVSMGLVAARGAGAGKERRECLAELRL